MRTFLVALLALSLSLPAFAGLQRLSLSDALRAKVVEVKATGNGGYQGKKLKLQVINKSGNPLQLTVDQGVIFRPADTTEQDLVTAGMEMLAIQPFKDATTDVQTFCAKSYGGSPDAGREFSFLKKGSDTLVRALSFLKTNFLLDRPIAQYAVWTITNNTSLENVYEYGNELISEKVLDFLVALTGRPKPNVFRQMAPAATPDAPAYNPKSLKIFAKMEVELAEPAKLTLGVYDAQGTMVQKVFENQQFAGKKGHRFRVEFQAADVPAGAYYIRLKKGDAVLEERSVVVE